MAQLIWSILENSLCALDNNVYSALLVRFSVYVCQVQLVYSIFQRNRIDGPEANQNIYGQLIFNKDAKTIKKEKNILFNKCHQHNWISTYKIMKLGPYLILNIKLNSTWIKDLMSLKLKTMKLLKESIGTNFHDLGFGNRFLEHQKYN